MSNTLSKQTSLDQAAALIGKLIKDSKIDTGKLITTKPVVLKSKITQVFKNALEKSNYSYDPTTGEIIFTIPHHVGIMPLEKMEDGRQAGVHIREHFEEEGWEDVVVLTQRVGVEHSSIKLRSSKIAAMAFLNKTTASTRKKG